MNRKDAVIFFIITILVVALIPVTSLFSVYADDVPETGAGNSRSVDRTWEFSTFGTSVSTDYNGYDGDISEGSIRLFSENGTGKLVPASTDGLAFYYTAIDPETENFKLKAKANVNSWKYTNGQEGFGLMAADRVGINGDKRKFWNNSYMATVSRVTYLWDGTKISNSGDEIIMKLGIGAQEKKGVTLDNITENMELRDMSLFSSSLTPLETSCADLGEGSYNIVGNYTNPTPPEGTIDQPLTTFDLCIEKNNTGYFVSYTDPAGVTTTKKYYDTTALRALDPGNVYVGFFTSRHCDVTFTDISLTTSDPSGDPPAEERPITYVDPLYTVESPEYTNNPSYTLIYKGNADGTLNVTQNGTSIYEGQVTAGTKTRIPAELSRGSNCFELTTTPDPSLKPSEYEELSTYEPVTITSFVTYDVSTAKTVYVSPDGSDDAAGTSSDPLSITAAVTKASPGQTIYMQAGSYLMDGSLLIGSGLSGTASSKITLAADPNAASRPVIDFRKRSTGLVIAADHWHFKGFDVTGTKDLEVGIRLSGSYNTLELIHTYKNGDSGIWISALDNLETRDEWPRNNLILNCTSMMNADIGMTDADGFAAKEAVGDNNVFDGCIACYNADDGFDLFAKSEFGPVGKTIIRNCVAYKNGLLLSDDGKEIDAGDGNGFKMGGQDLPGGHELINSTAFANTSNGVTSNSCPNITLKNCTFFNNNYRNITLGSSVINTDYMVNGVISYGSSTAKSDSFILRGTQDVSKIYGETNFYNTNGKSSNTAGLTVSDAWFVSIDTDKALSGGITWDPANGRIVIKSGGITRNADGSINMNGYLAPTASVPAGVGARIGIKDTDDASGDEPAPAHDDPSPDIKNGTKWSNAQGTFRVLSVNKKTVAFIKASASKKSISIPASIKINGVKYSVTKIAEKAFMGSKALKATIGSNVKTIAKYAFKSSAVKTLIVKSKKLTKSSVKGSLKSSKVKTVRIKVGSKKLNKKYLKRYKKIFTRKNAGRKVTLKIA